MAKQRDAMIIRANAHRYPDMGQPDHYMRVLKQNKANVVNIYSQQSVPNIKDFARNHLKAKKNMQTILDK